MLVRVVLNPNGELSVYVWINNNSWSLIWFQPQSSCGVYGICGAYGVCFTHEDIQSCSCTDGFQPRNPTAWRSQEWWSSGCVRHTPLNCSSINGSDSTTTDGFLQLNDKSLSDEDAVQYVQESTVQGCKTACLNNCSCTAFAFTDSNSGVCKLWFGDLLSIQSKSNSSEGQPFFIRLAASDVSQLSGHAGSSISRVVALSISIPLAVALLGSLFAWFIQRRRRALLEKGKNYDMPTTLRIFTYRDKNYDQQFRPQVGKGSIWVCLQRNSPRLVAVKRLEGSSQAEKKFRAETSTIGNIHHMNFVRLRGFCVEGSH